MNIIDSLKWRYAVKKFDTKKDLSEIQIETLKQAFNFILTLSSSHCTTHIRLFFIEFILI